MTDCDITIVDGKKIISDDVESAKTSKKQYINAVEINSGFKPLKTTNQSKDGFSVIDEIIRTYQDHPGVKQINNAIPATHPSRISQRIMVIVFVGIRMKFHGDR